MKDVDIMFPTDMYLLVYCRLIGLVTGHQESRVLFDVFLKIPLFCPVMKTIFQKLFLKCSHFITISKKSMKPSANGHIYSRLSYLEKYL